MFITMVFTIQWSIQSRYSESHAYTCRFTTWLQTFNFGPSKTDHLQLFELDQNVIFVERFTRQNPSPLVRPVRVSSKTAKPSNLSYGLRGPYKCLYQSLNLRHAKPRERNNLKKNSKLFLRMLNSVRVKIHLVA